MEELYCDEKRQESLVFISHTKGMTVLFLDCSNQKVIPVCHKNMRGIREAVICGERMFCRYDRETKEIFELDEELNIINRLPLKSLGVLATDGYFLYAGGESALISFTPDLKEIDRYFFFKDFPVPLEKDAHEILVHEKTAYVLDNIECPVYLFKIAIADNGTLSLIRDLEILDTYAHLDGQWINPAWEQWMVLQSTSHKAGQQQYIYDFGTKNLFRELKYSLYSKLYTPFGEKGHIIEEGLRVLGVNSFPPIWGITTWEEEYMPMYGLIGIYSDPETVFWDEEPWVIPEFSDPPNTYRKFLLKRRGGHLFVAPERGNKLALFDVQEEPFMVAFFDLKEQGIEEIINIHLL